MTEIQRLESDLFDAELHLENAKTYIQMKGVNYHTVAIYCDAKDRVQRIREKLEEAKK